jgi:23S rRNA (pseudouridine1915-N3)-methyltransferase
MRIVISLVSECKNKEMKDLALEWVKRAGKFSQVKYVEFRKGEKLGEIKQKYKNFHTIALAEKGRVYNSLKFAERLEKLASYQSSNLLFVVSDAEGFGKEELSESDELLSLSALTFPHELAVVVLSEQVYRGLSIIHNHPYHRE